MLEYLLLIPSLFTFQNTQQDELSVPIHVAAENLMLSAAHLTVQQLNNACETVCGERDE